MEALQGFEISIISDNTVAQRCQLTEIPGEWSTWSMDCTQKKWGALHRPGGHSSCSQRTQTLPGVLDESLVTRRSTIQIPQTQSTVWTGQGTQEAARRASEKGKLLLGKEKWRKGGYPKSSPLLAPGVPRGHNPSTPTAQCLPGLGLISVLKTVRARSYCCMRDSDSNTSGARNKICGHYSGNPTETRSEVTGCLASSILWGSHWS